MCACTYCVTATYAATMMMKQTATVPTQLAISTINCSDSANHCRILWRVVGRGLRVLFAFGWLAFEPLPALVIVLALGVALVDDMAYLLVVGWGLTEGVRDDS